MLNLSEFLDNESFEAIDEQYLSFRDCPNKCIRGKLFNPYTQKETECEYCASKRKRLIKTPKINNLKEELQLPETSLGGDTYDPDAIFLNLHSDTLNEANKQAFIEELVVVEKQLSQGSILQHSYLFCFSTTGVFLNDYINTLMLGAYNAGIRISPYLSLIDIVRMKNDYARNKSEAYKNLMEVDLLVVYVEDCETSSSLNILSGLMQQRAFRNKPTLLFATTWSSAFYRISDTGITSFAIARLYRIEDEGKPMINTSYTATTPAERLAQAQGMGPRRRTGVLTDNAAPLSSQSSISSSKWAKLRS